MPSILLSGLLPKALSSSGLSRIYLDLLISTLLLLFLLLSSLLRLGTIFYLRSFISLFSMARVCNSSVRKKINDLPGEVGVGLPQPKDVVLE